MAGRVRKPAKVGQYELFFELASSYLGPLWLARFAGARALAIARSIPLAGLTTDQADRLERAGRTAARLEHPALLTALELERTADALLLVSDCTEGDTLRAVHGMASVRRHPMPADIALRVARDILEALTALHEGGRQLQGSGSVYGGLSPDSLWLSTSGRTMVLDPVVGAAASSLAPFSSSPDRIAYCAPEQLGRGGTPDARTDLFVVGVLLWELLSNRRLFIGSDQVVVQKVLSGKIPKLTEVKRRGDTSIPTDLVSLVARALERSPERRFQSATEMLDAVMVLKTDGASPDDVGAFVNKVSESALERRRDAAKDLLGPEATPRLSDHLGRSAAPTQAAQPAPAPTQISDGSPVPVPMTPIAKPGPQVTARSVASPKPSTPLAAGAPRKPMGRRKTALGMPSVRPVGPRDAQPAIPQASAGLGPRPSAPAGRIAAPPPGQPRLPRIAPRSRQQTMLGIPLPASVNQNLQKPAGVKPPAHDRGAPKSSVPEALPVEPPAPAAEAAGSTTPAAEAPSNTAHQSRTGGAIDEGIRSALLSDDLATTDAPISADPSSAAGDPFDEESTEAYDRGAVEALAANLTGRAQGDSNHDSPPTGETPERDSDGLSDAETNPPPPATPPPVERFAATGPTPRSAHTERPAAHDDLKAEQATDRPKGPDARAASPAMFPSRIPPPLIHDPRARRRLDGGHKPARSASLTRTLLIGLAVGLVTVAGGVALALWVIHQRGAATPAASATASAPAPVASAPAAASAVAASAAPRAADGGHDAGLADAAADAHFDAATDAPAESDAPAASASVVAPAAPPPVTRFPKPRPRPRAAPKPRKYIPDDI